MDIKELFNKIYYRVLDFYSLSQDECISILAEKTNMFEMSNRILLENKVSRKKFFEAVMGELTSEGIVRWGWEFFGVRKGRFLKMIKDQREMFFERMRLSERMTILEETELKGLSEEEVHLIKKGNQWSAGFAVGHITPKKEDELAKKYEYFRLRMKRENLDSKVRLSFEGDS
jgi:hypothetical protein